MEEEDPLRNVNVQLLEDSVREESSRASLYLIYAMMFLCSFSCLMTQPTFQQTCIDVICDEIYPHLHASNYVSQHQPEPIAGLSLFHDVYNENPARNCSSTKVTNKAATWSQWFLVTGSGCALLTVGSLGVNSDIYGRLGILRLNVFALALQLISFLLVEVVPSIRVYWLRETFIGANVVYGLTGGFVVTIMQLFACAADIRCRFDWIPASVFAILEAMIGLGSLVGCELGGQLSSTFGKQSVYLLALVLAVVVFIASCFAKESLALKDRKQKTSCLKATVFGLASYAILWKPLKHKVSRDVSHSSAVLEPQQRLNSVHKWALPIVAFAFFSAFVGVIGSLFSVVVNYLVSLGLSTTLVGHFYASGSAGRFLSVWFASRYLRGQGNRHELALAAGYMLLAAIMFSFMGLAVTPLPVLFVLNFFTNSIVGVAFGIMRSFLTRHMPRSEQGVALSATAGVEIIAGILTPFLFEQLWRASSDWFPGLFYIIVGGFVLLSSFLSACAVKFAG